MSKPTVNLRYSASEESGRSGRSRPYLDVGTGYTAVKSARILLREMLRVHPNARPGRELPFPHDRPLRFRSERGAPESDATARLRSGCRAPGEMGASHLRMPGHPRSRSPIQPRRPSSPCPRCRHDPAETDRPTYRLPSAAFHIHNSIETLPSTNDCSRRGGCSRFSPRTGIIRSVHELNRNSQPVNDAIANVIKAGTRNRLFWFGR